MKAYLHSFWSTEIVTQPGVDLRTILGYPIDIQLDRLETLLQRPLCGTNIHVAEVGRDLCRSEILLISTYRCSLPRKFYLYRNTFLIIFS